jgi:hypothetical protein
MRLTLVFATLLGAAGVAQAQEGSPPNPFGLGLIVGEPNVGLSAKYYIGNKMGIAAALGDTQRGWADDGIHLHVDVLWHPKVLTRQPAFDLPFYVGVGGRFLQHDGDFCDRNGNCFDYDDDQHLGVRVPFGILMDFNNVPLDVFFELSMTLDLIVIDNDDFDNDDDDVDLYLSGALGARYYF